MSPSSNSQDTVSPRGTPDAGATPAGLPEAIKTSTQLSVPPSIALLMMAARLAQHRMKPDDPHAIFSLHDPARLGVATRWWAEEHPESASLEFYRIIDRISRGEQP